ncbi:MAG TPA: AMP-dependent synthetase/ligase, partial [Pirellulales bacterium]|nr:AMP-dependent synthetase/ligase [Pirellulales bacterium]
MYDTRETLVAMFCSRVRRQAHRTALHLPAGEGKFRTLSWHELAQDVRRTALVLRRLGVRPGDRVVQVSENRYEWIVVDLAVHLARGVHVAVHAALSGPQIGYQIIDSGARVAIVSGAEQLAKLAQQEIGLPDGLQWITFDPIEQQHEQSLGGRQPPMLVKLLDELAGDQASSEQAEQLESDSHRETQPNDLATILYTSGTTGEPKGVMLSHRNLASNAVATLAAFDYSPDDLRLSWLPLSHIFSRTCDLYTWIASGSQLALAESRDKILANCHSLRPTMLNGVPYFFDKVRRYVIGEQKANEPGWLAALFGGRMRLCCSGGAALPNETAEFFWQRGVPLLQGYGLTESSPVITISTATAHKLGTVGRPISGVEVGIAEDGEILTRGPHVMLGYWNRPDDTADAIRDGWLLTGDRGQLDCDGYLKITGRKKELIVTAGGKNIAPVYLENLLVEDPLIAQAMVIGEGRNYLTALIVPNPEALRAAIAERQIPVHSVAEALVHPEVLALYRQQIDLRLRDLADCEKVQRFMLLSRGFTLELGELTPTLKLRRTVVQQHFTDEIKLLYAE